MADVTIEARLNGPYVVTGTIELRDTSGTVLSTQTRTVLCRCGASTKKPFCDGTHSKIGFQAAAQAVLGGRCGRLRHWGDISGRHGSARRSAGRYRICRRCLWRRSGRCRKGRNQRFSIAGVARTTIGGLSVIMELCVVAPSSGATTRREPYANEPNWSMRNFWRSL
jgi:CDGSH-type Zn-finger protein